VLGAVDLARFRPGAPDPRLRAALGLAPASRVVGVVARIQAHRRFDLLLAGFRRLAERDPGARLLVVGRGTREDEVARRPAERLGLAGRVVFAGQRGADYPEVLRAIDVLAYLAPGSDGSCRAVLEAAACGIPAVASRRGALPELVRHGETGLLVAEDPAALAAAFESLLAEPGRRSALGAAARARAELLFAPERLAERVAALYAGAARLPPTPP
jgi:glycosyltransferase involved in cell wall biosynthesis